MDDVDGGCRRAGQVQSAGSEAEGGAKPVQGDGRGEEHRAGGAPSRDGQDDRDDRRVER